MKQESFNQSAIRALCDNWPSKSANNSLGEQFFLSRLNYLNSNEESPITITMLIIT